MVTEDYVSFEVAKLLKEKGFDEYCGYYSSDGEYWGYCVYNHKGKDYISAPTLQMTMKWLREVHNIILNIFYCDNDWVSEYYGKDDSTIIGDYKTYEEACESGIKYALENLI